MVQERLSTRDRHDRRATIVHGIKAFLDAQTLVQDFVGIVDFAATGASQVAPKQRFQHENQRIPFTAKHMLFGNIGTDISFLQQRYSHWYPFQIRASAAQIRAQRSILILSSCKFSKQSKRDVFLFAQRPCHSAT